MAFDIAGNNVSQAEGQAKPQIRQMTVASARAAMLTAVAPLPAESVPLENIAAV